MLSARFTDPDDDEGRVALIIWDDATNTYLGVAFGSQVPSGGFSTFEVPTEAALPTERTYRIEAYSVDETVHASLTSTVTTFMPTTRPREPVAVTAGVFATRTPTLSARGDIAFISDNAMHIVETDAAGRAPLVDRTVPVDPTWSNSPVIVGDDVWVASWQQNPTGQSVTVLFKPADPTGDRVVVPDLTGRNVGDARAALNGAGLSAGIDPSIDSDDADAILGGTDHRRSPSPATRPATQFVGGQTTSARPR